MQIKEIYNINYGKGLYTEVVQRAVDECSANGGGIVRFEKGVYVLSTVFLKSNVTIEIPEGTELLGAESYYVYTQEEQVDYSWIT
jgi:polygalacturonase